MKMWTKYDSLLCNTVFVVILAASWCRCDATASSQPIDSHKILVARSLKDRLSLNEDGITHVDPIEQDAILDMLEHNCTERIINSTHNPANCPIDWDTIICWPETPVNKTVYVDCPKYVDNFKIYNKASKTCILNKTNNKPMWTKSDLNPCIIHPVIEEDDEMESLERHMMNIIYIRICGYVASMVSLALSIIILLRPKLRCPRNYVHVNLFLAFVIRTILVMLVDVILHNKTSAVFQIKTNQTNITDLMQAQYIPCQIMISLFRYSGSVYHVAIFSEALYLVLLLRFPYYNEKKGSKFCIIAAWAMPFLWIIPWVVVKRFVDNKWCWQMESDWNLIIKIPHSLLLVVNIASAVFIIKVLYSKMRKRLTKEKILKYRRLAKSILILIPIFGLHFIVFAWLPYASIINLSQTFEIISSYVETFFNAFQGVVVSIVCCFIHREVRIECLLFACELLKKIRCLQPLSCMKCLDSDYIRQLRYAYNENRAGSISPRMPLNGNFQRPDNASVAKIYNDTIVETPNGQQSTSKSKLKKMCSCAGSRRESAESADVIVVNPPAATGLSKTRTYSTNDSIADVSVNNVKRRSSASQSLMSSGPTRFQQFFGCLFSNKRNDFHQYNGGRRTLLSTSSTEPRRTTKDSIKPSISDEPAENVPSSGKNSLVKLFRFDDRNLSETWSATSNSNNNKKKVRLLLSANGENAEPSRLNSHKELDSNELCLDQTTMNDEEAARNKLTTADQRAAKSRTSSELSSLDCQLNNTTTESTNWTDTNLTNSSSNLPLVCSRCQKRRVSSISHSFYHSDDQQQQPDEDSLSSKYCKCRLDLLINEASQILPSLSTQQHQQQASISVQEASQEKQPLLSSQHSSLESDRS